MKKGFNPKPLAYSGVCLALAAALSYYAKLPLPFWPQGGSVTLCSMFFVALAGWWFGPAVGFAASMSYGLLQFILDGYTLSPINMLLDYPLAFGALGLMSLFRNWKSPIAIYAGFLTAALGRFCFSFISGLVFYTNWAEVNLWSGVSFSVVYNLGYILPEVALTFAVISIPSFKKALTLVARRSS